MQSFHPALFESMQDPQNYAIIAAASGPMASRASATTALSTATATGEAAHQRPSRAELTRRGAVRQSSGLVDRRLAVLRPPPRFLPFTSWMMLGLQPEGTDGAPIDIFKFALFPGENPSGDQDSPHSNGDGALGYIVGA